jgi:hypothetical protein
VAVSGTHVPRDDLGVPEQPPEAPTEDDPEPRPVTMPIDDFVRGTPSKPAPIRVGTPIEHLSGYAVRGHLTALSPDERAGAALKLAQEVKARIDTGRASSGEDQEEPSADRGAAIESLLESINETGSVQTARLTDITDLLVMVAEEGYDRSDADTHDRKWNKKMTWAMLIVALLSFFAGVVAAVAAVALL